MVCLNVGCGPDPWGDVRVDLYDRVQTHVGGTRSKLNVRADAHYLPFKEKAFEQTRCFHVLEHLGDPLKAILEIRRVSHRFELRFPVGDGYKREMLWMISNLSFSGILNAYRTRAWKLHIWAIHPSKATVGYRRLFWNCFCLGRKARYLGRFEPYLPKLRYEWIVTG